MDQILHIAVGNALEDSFYPDEPVNLILTDPPFPAKTQIYKQIRSDPKIKLEPIETPTFENYLDFWEKCLIIWQSKLTKDGWLVFKSDDFGSKYVFSLTQKYFNYIGDVIWDKISIGLGYYLRKQHEVLSIYRPLDAKKSYFLKYPKKNLTPKKWHGSGKGIAFSSVIRILRQQNGILGQHNTVKHINQTPYQLWEKFIQWMCPKTGIIVDPFMGSGSIGKAVQHLNIFNTNQFRYWGFDCSEKHVQLSKQNLNPSCNLNFIIKEKEFGL